MVLPTTGAARHNGTYGYGLGLRFQGDLVSTEECSPCETYGLFWAYGTAPFGLTVLKGLFLPPRAGTWSNTGLHPGGDYDPHGSWVLVSHGRQRPQQGLLWHIERSRLKLKHNILTFLQRFDSMKMEAQENMMVMRKV